jgi:hypothetical protein
MDIFKFILKSRRKIDLFCKPKRGILLSSTLTDTIIEFVLLCFLNNLKTELVGILVPLSKNSNLSRKTQSARF